MPTLEWLGKSKVVAYHRQVPYRVLERIPEKSVLDSHGSDCGNIWANAAGGAYRYFMVFAHDPLEGTGAYAIDEFRQILGQIG